MTLETIKEYSTFRKDVMPIIDYLSILYHHTNDDYYKQRLDCIDTIVKQMEILHKNGQK